MNHTVSSPGKLLLAGEYGVLNPGSGAVVIAVNRFLRVTAVEPAAAENFVRGEIHSKHFNEPIYWNLNDGVNDNKHDELTASLIKIVIAFAAESQKPINVLKLFVESELDSESGAKYGLGSSAAYLVSMIKIFDRLFSWHLSDKEIYKLAVLAKWQVQKNAAGADVAASAFGGWIHYASPDRSFVLEHLAQKGVYKTVKADWPFLKIEQLPHPEAVNFTVVWTKTPADTSKLISRKYLTAKEERVFIEKSDEAVFTLTGAIKQDSGKSFIAAIEASKENLLKHIGNNNPSYQTAELLKVDEIATKNSALAKISGAGGGDCAVIFSAKEQSTANLLQELKQQRLEHLEMQIAFKEHYE